MRPKFRKPSALLIIGLWLMALANSWHWFVSRVAHLSEGITDLTFGFFMGAAIGLLLLHVVCRNKVDCAPRHS